MWMHHKKEAAFIKKYGMLREVTVFRGYAFLSFGVDFASVRLNLVFYDVPLQSRQYGRNKIRAL